MKFAKIVFWIVGIWGVLVITPLYFLFDQRRAVCSSNPALNNEGNCTGLCCIYCGLE